MTNKQNEIADFSILLGGPLYRFYLWSGLAKRPLLHSKRRMIAISLFTWLPLFILAILGGVAFSGVQIPFISNIDVHIRFLVSLPLLIYAEVIVQERLPILVKQFLNCNLISDSDRPKFNSHIASAIRMTNSSLAEFILLLLVFTIGHAISASYFPLDVSAWYATTVHGVMKLTPTGYWYAFVSLPLFQFILLRWYYRMGIWYRFLWQTSRLSLRLNSLHPDRSGGLGFLTNSVYAFEPLLLAHSVLLAGMILNQIWNTGAALSQFQGEVISMLIFLFLLPLTPLIFFITQLINTKRYGTLDYDRVANHYVNEFRKKWIDAEPNNNQNLLGTSDIQSLADLTNSFNVSASMRIIPVSRGTVMLVVILTSLPLLPLILTVIPIEKIIHQLIGIAL